MTCVAPTVGTNLLILDFGLDAGIEGGSMGAVGGSSFRPQRCLYDLILWTLIGAER